MKMERPGQIQEILINYNIKDMMVYYMEGEKEGGNKDYATILT